ncbi:MAG: DsrE family protein [Gammaproteobacteria bacterium]|nr:DsrE family protein [Gammaproteobacteria bacterium]MDH5729206.1 DsrE family protein [Gammaproteobacteria bacterium]
MKKVLLLLLLTICLSFASILSADDRDDDDEDFWNQNNFVVSKWADINNNPLTLDEKFGDGTSAVTRFLSNTRKAKVLYQINETCKDATCAAPYAIGNIINHVNDYEITHGMSKRNYEIVVVVHSAGWRLVLDNNAASAHAISNPFQAAVEKLLSNPSIKVLFCQNTAHGKAITKDQMIDGIGFVTAGVSALADFQDQGYRYVQP